MTDEQKRLFKLLEDDLPRTQDALNLASGWLFRIKTEVEPKEARTK